MTVLFAIAIFGLFYGILLYLLFRPCRSSLEKKVRSEESGLKRFGFRQIAGGHYILKSGETGIYTRAEALKTMKKEIEVRIKQNKEHANSVNHNTA
jgi:hypothetical protein